MTVGESVVAHALVKRFGLVVALDGVDLVAPEGSILAVLGPNGAGKTTALRILAGVLRPDSGQAKICGHDVVTDAAAVRSLIGVTGQSITLDAALTGRQNLQFIGRLHHLNTAEARRRSGELLDQLDLTDAADRPVATYSAGMRRRIDIAAGLIGQPRVLFLDEPTTGLDLPSRIGLWQLIRARVDNGTTVVLTTQYLEEADQAADRITVIDRGRVVAAGTPNELRSRVPGRRLELRVADLGDLSRATDLVAACTGRRPDTDARTGQLSLTVTDGDTLLAELARRLDAAGIESAELSLSRPTLDDVFLALIGSASPATANPPASSTRTGS
jgi:daunorubicin resistance ABC transporter ATP-binding subunit